MTIGTKRSGGTVRYEGNNGLAEGGGWCIISFYIEAEAGESGARAGVLETGHGKVKTPAFMPVATKANVKLMTPDMLRECGAQAVISNAFILSLRPGEDLIREKGGLHRFMNWEGTIFTDSGGFQIIRKGFLKEINEEGILFRSPFDGRDVLFGPERCAGVQAKLGSDIAMALDYCPPHDASPAEVKEAVQRTELWASRFLESYRKEGKGLAFGITQGGTDQKMRERSTLGLTNMEFDGYGIGGLSIGEEEEDTFRTLEQNCKLLPEGKPRYFMGLGKPDQLIRAVKAGVDVFDSVYPTRNGRHGTALVRRGKLNLRNRRYLREEGPLDPDCGCMVCRDFGRGYLAHLAREEEFLAMALLTYHNLHFMGQLMLDIRTSIKEGDWGGLEERYNI